MKNFLLKLVREDRGQDVIEYVLLAAGISIVAIITIPAIGDEVVVRYNEVLTALTVALTVLTKAGERLSRTANVLQPIFQGPRAC